MLNENAINALPEAICARLEAINTRYLETIGKRIREIGEMKPTDINRAQIMYQCGMDVDTITRQLANASGKNVKEIQDIFSLIAKENYEYSRPFFEAQGMEFIPFEENEPLQRYVESISRQTVGEYINLTQNTAFAVFDKTGNVAPLFASNEGKVATSLHDTYTKVIDEAVTAAQLGYTDYQSAMRQTLKALADSGIRIIDYATGYSRRADSAVRQNLLWAIKQCNQESADMVGEQFGADGYEISYHGHPRPSHEEMGGKQYAIGKARTVNGVYYSSFDTVAHLLQDYGCLHFKFSIILGISEPAYDPEQLAAFKAADKETFEFEGQKYTKYEASQVQRKLETAIRHQKDRANIAKAAGDDDMRRQAQEKINHLASKYKKLSDVSGLPTKAQRMSVSGFRRVKTRAELTNKTNNDILFTGARITDQYSKKAKRFAKSYYEEIRHYKDDVKTIARHTGKKVSEIKKIKKYLFLDESLYDEDLGAYRRFDPDCAIAQSWQRLMIGKDIKPHDLTLIEHELYEMELKASGITDHLEAHRLASKKFNYGEEADLYYGNLERNKKAK